VAADILPESCEETAGLIREAGGTAHSFPMDVTSRKEVVSLMETAREEFGGLDILVNNAGITRDARLENMTDEQFDKVIDINLKAVFYCGQEAARIMMEQRSGVILNASSFVGVYGNFGQTNYAASKFGVIGMTKTWAKELGPRGIRVNAVAPGFILTPMTEKVPEKVLSAFREKCPLRKLGRPEDIAHAYLFLASDDAGYINGAVLEVTGGLVV
jgi:3-oxoacyl-[acyl-carrier protein] reductase